MGSSWLILPALVALLTHPVHAESSCNGLDPCAAKICEVDAAIELARKEGSMRKLATLKDVRVETLRCRTSSDKAKKS